MVTGDEDSYIPPSQREGGGDLYLAYTRSPSPPMRSPEFPPRSTVASANESIRGLYQPGGILDSQTTDSQWVATLNGNNVTQARSQDSSEVVDDLEDVVYLGGPAWSVSNPNINDLFDQLKHAIETLTAENAHLRTKLQFNKTQNTSLQSQLARLQNEGEEKDQFINELEESFGRLKIKAPRIGSGSRSHVRAHIVKRMRDRKGA